MFGATGPGVVSALMTVSTALIVAADGIGIRAL